jgi:phosphoesterase RecJ-like protein
VSEAAPARDPAPSEVGPALDRAAEILRAAPSVALACHVNPDPDAAGSMLGLAHHLAGLGTSVVCSWGNQPMDRPRWLGLLDGAPFLVEPSSFPHAPEVMVSLDTAAPERLGMLAANASRAGELIVVDHHRTNPGFGSLLVLDHAAASTAELVFRVIERLGGELSGPAAACLYAGVVTDTGRFQYEATTPETLRIAARLRERPFDHTRMAQVLFEDNPIGYLRVLAHALTRLVHRPDADLVWTYVMQADLRDAGVGLGDADDVIDAIRTAREADVACVIKQQRDGRFKVSLRSKGATDVGSVAAVASGGGHRLAAGYISTVGPEETVERLVERIAAVRGGRPGVPDVGS